MIDSKAAVEGGQIIGQLVHPGHYPMPESVQAPKVDPPGITGPDPAPVVPSIDNYGTCPGTNDPSDLNKCHIDDKKSEKRDASTQVTVQQFSRIANLFNLPKTGTRIINTLLTGEKIIIAKSFFYRCIDSIKFQNSLDDTCTLFHDSFVELMCIINVSCIDFTAYRPYSV